MNLIGLNFRSFSCGVWLFSFRLARFFFISIYRLYHMAFCPKTSSFSFERNFIYIMLHKITIAMLNICTLVVVKPLAEFLDQSIPVCIKYSCMYIFAYLWPTSLCLSPWCIGPHRQHWHVWNISHHEGVFYLHNFLFIIFFIGKTICCLVGIHEQRYRRGENCLTGFCI